MKDVIPEKYVDMMLEPPPSPMITECCELEKLPNGDKIMYHRMKIPLITDRDNVAIFHHEKVEGGGLFLITKSIVHKEKPVIKKVIRMFQ